MINVYGRNNEKINSVVEELKKKGIPYDIQEADAECYIVDGEVICPFVDAFAYINEQSFI